MTDYTETTWRSSKGSTPSISSWSQLFCHIFLVIRLAMCSHERLWNFDIDTGVLVWLMQAEAGGRKHNRVRGVGKPKAVIPISHGISFSDLIAVKCAVERK